ncbi:hypothetical protein EI555_011154, partial [Monodon monoceros]
MGGLATIPLLFPLCQERSIPHCQTLSNLLALKTRWNHSLSCCEWLVSIFLPQYVGIHAELEIQALAKFTASRHKGKHVLIQQQCCTYSPSYESNITDLSSRMKKAINHVGNIYFADDFIRWLTSLPGIWGMALLGILPCLAGILGACCCVYCCCGLGM